MELIGKVWTTWKRFAQIVGDFIGRIVLTLFYFTIFVPFGLGVRLLGDPLAVRCKQDVRWLERRTGDPTLDDARRLS